LAEISKWDGTEEQLYQPFSKEMPQAEFYQNLAELLEQWTNDIIWFQHSLFSITSQDDREKQIQLMGLDENYLPIRSYTSKFLNADQIQEFVFFFNKMPKSFCLEFGGAKHSTAAYRKEKLETGYFDPNFKFRTSQLKDSLELFKRMVDYKYIRLKQYPENQENFDIELYFLYFKGQEKVITNTPLLEEQELPKSLEEANAFHQKSPNKMNHLHWAIIARSIPTLEKLLKDNFCDINAENMHNISPLQLAIQTGFDEGIKRLLTQPNINLQKAAFEAYQKDNFPLLHAILNNPNANNLSDLLTLAIARRDIALVRFLISYNRVDIANKSSYGDIPLMTALWINSSETAHLLLDKGAKVNFLQKFRPHFCNYHQPCFWFSEEGYTPLALAFAIKDLDNDILKKILSNLAYINELDESGNAAIHYVKDIDTLQYLLEQKADIYLKNREGKTFLHLCVEKSEPSVQLFKYALDNKKNEPENPLLLELIISAITWQNEALFKYLMEFIKDKKGILNHPNKSGVLPLHYACRHTSFNFLKLLLENGADINAKSKTINANTPLHVLIQYRNRENIKAFLAEENCRVDIPNNAGKTAYDLLKEFGYEDLCQGRSTLVPTG
jgi:ankyrin repeat protein